MKERRWQLALAAGLVASSALLYFMHYLIFHDPHHIFIYMVGDIAFVPVEVLLVTMILHRLLERREHKAQLNKLNMVIGAFFSEVGTGLIGRIAAFDVEFDEIRSDVVVTQAWKDKDFEKARAGLMSYDYSIEMEGGDLADLREYLSERRQFLLGLLGNQNLLEHEAFTELLWAVFHLTEELHSRTDLSALPVSDQIHLAGDIKRAYTLLAAEWLAYMKHLKTAYPYLFSLAVRTNPLDPTAHAEVTE
jgi:hypothetical protein